MTNKIKGGYKGRILRINLSTSEIENFPLDVDLAEKYIGGIGLNTYYLYHELNPHTEPLSPDNVLILGIGPLVGTGAPGSDRVELTGKSPLTNGFGSANAGVFLGIEFKQVGFDHIILKGKAPKPVYVWIHEQCVEIIEATHLWGKTTWETVSIIRHELRDEKVHVISIGPAGEKLVRFANVQNGFYSGFSRGGLGAIMGSKNLKAIAVRGTSKKVPIANVEKFTRATQEAFSRIKKDPFYSATVKYGSMAFAAGELVPNDKISAEYFYENLKEKTLGCYNCPMPCAHWVKIKKGPYKGTQLRGGEVAPLFAFSRACQIMDQEMVIKYSELCLKYGLDMISTAVTIGWAMDCYERGLIDKKDTGGFEIKKGDGEIVLDLINMIVSREGFGDILAEGSFRASELIGKETKEYLMGVKGMEIYSDPRLGLPGWAWCFSQAVSARGDPAKPHP
ncbi:MAG: aldehyde ferredoxin oxidoreductase N-terminal domain-containing protein, partial [Candidatus Aerophobetes bacterium]|nr:aldehyde ferredoxin oxidoreductase N-terminal domain-containing protein [Candidatus Aerophobetes bacterium]